MANLQKLIQSARHFNSITCVSYKVSFGSVIYSVMNHNLATTTSQFHRPVLNEPKLQPDISSLQAFVRRFIHTSNVSEQDIRYKDYIKMLKQGMKIVDVRNPGEIKNMGAVYGSFEIPLDRLKQEFSLSPTEWKEKYRRGKPSEDTPIMVICASGVRSKSGAKMLQQMGYKQPISYRGGYKMFKDKK